MRPGIFAKIFRMGVLLDTDSTIRGYNESPTSITLRVPYIYQQHVNLCADVSAMMILQAWGFTPNRTTDNNPRLPFKGSCIEDHTDLYAYGKLDWGYGFFNFNDVKMVTLLNWLQTRGPIGVSNKGHAQVLIGIDTADSTVILHDPWKGPNKINTFDKFKGEMLSYAYLKKVGIKVLSEHPAAWKR